LKVTDLGKSARTYRVNLTKGDEILSGLTEFAEKYHIKNGHFPRSAQSTESSVGRFERGSARRKSAQRGSRDRELMGNISVNAQGSQRARAWNRRAFRWP
jgi:hypothetical protein